MISPKISKFTCVKYFIFTISIFDKLPVLIEYFSPYKPKAQDKQLVAVSLIQLDFIYNPTTCLLCWLGLEY